MGKISKGVKCSCNNCEQEAIRSINIGKAKQAGLKVEGRKRVYLCKDHYREYKKGNKKARKIERWRYGIN
jgi:hypothetical protein